MSAHLSVVHVGPDPQHPGGISTVITLLRKHRIGGPSDVIVSWVPGSRRARAGAFLRAAVQVARVSRRTLVHMHMAKDGSIPRKGLLLLVAKLTRHATVVTVHGSRFGASAARRPRLTAFVLRRCDLVLVLSDEMVEIVTRLAPRANVHLLFNPAEVATDATDAGAVGPRVLFAGEVGIRKGVDVLRAAWPAVRQAIPDATLTIAGPPTDLSVEPFAGLDVIGPVDRDHIQTLLRQHRVAALPSRAEALPMFLLEAMGSARPFVGTDVGDVRRLAEGGAGTLVPVDDASALAEAIIGYLADSERATTAGRVGHAACVESFSVAALAERAEALYDDVRRT